MTAGITRRRDIVAASPQDRDQLFDDVAVVVHEQESAERIRAKFVRKNRIMG